VSAIAAAAKAEIERLRPPAHIQVDVANDIITIHGVRYAGALFAHLGFGPVGGTFKIVAREDGVVTLAMVPDWRPIETAPVEPAEKASSYYRFRCLLQNARGEVFEGWGYYVKLGRATSHMTLRWKNDIGQCFPKYWMPLPAPHKEPGQ
jgi:hypothetical protein